MRSRPTESDLEESSGAFRCCSDHREGGGSGESGRARAPGSDDSQANTAASVKKKERNDDDLSSLSFPDLWERYVGAWAEKGFSKEVRKTAFDALEWLAFKYGYPLPEAPLAGAAVVEVGGEKPKTTTKREKKQDPTTKAKIIKDEIGR